MEKIRQPIVSVMGHVDHGKTTVLDHIRGSRVAAREAGAITQAIGASIIPLDVLKKTCGNLLDALKLDLTIPGLLFIDTPGHAAFTNLRKRGGNLADIAILVIDINEGLMPQTLEAIDILKTYKTPFIIALNKIDLIGGFQDKPGTVLQRIEAQSDEYRKKIEAQLYEVVGKLHEHGFNADRFDRVSDYTAQVALVPTAAKFGVGIPELLMVLTGLAQRYLEQSLKCNVTGPAKGTVLEVKEEKGLGTTIDVILYDGSLEKNDTVVIGTLAEPIVVKIRALLEPMPLVEMMEKKGKYKQVKEAHAATGVKISAPGMEEAVAGMPIQEANPDEVEKIKEEVKREIAEVLVETEEQGIIVKADTLGSLEALTKLLQEAEIPIRKASIGDITKKDIADAQANAEKDPLLAVILGFNVKHEEVPENIKIITSDVIYKILEDYEKWKKEATKAEEAKQLDVLVRPCKLQIMPNYVFRQSNPAIVGVDILAGKIKTQMPLMKEDGTMIGEIKAIQQEQESIGEAEQGKQVAISLPNVTVGRQINENDILYSAIPEEDFRKLKELKQYLSKTEIEAVKQIAEIMRKQNPVWGV